MFEDYYFDDPALQGLLAAAGPIMDTPRQAAVMPMTTEAVAPYDLSLLAGLDLSGLGGLNFSGVGGGRMGSVIQDPNVQYITAPVSNKGNPTSKTSGNVFAVRTDQPVRLVDLRTKKVVFEGTGVEAARKATELGQNLTDTLGRKANYDIQTADPSGAFKTVANEKANKSVLGQIADVALPIAAGFIPGVGPVLGAALGSAASSAAQGRSLENTLLRAGLAAGGSALGGQLFGKAVPGGSAPMSGINADLIPNALEGLSFGSLTSAAIPAGVGGVAGNIIVNAATRAAPSLIGATLGSVASSALPSLISSPPSTPTEQAQTPEEIEAQRNPIVVKAPTNLLPADFITSAAAAAAANAANGMADAPDRAEMTDEELNTYMNAVGKGGGVLGTGLNVPQLLSIGGIGADLLKNLLAGGGDTGPTTPYVSPFGPGVGIGAGRDMRANPNITDYERYGFGPEAMFFQPGYGLLNSAAPAPAPAPQAQPIMATNPRYEPLI
jgi:hypothetical protein